MVILLSINVAFLSPAYFSGDILDQDDIKLGYAKSKEIRDYRAGNRRRSALDQCHV